MVESRLSRDGGRRSRERRRCRSYVRGRVRLAVGGGRRSRAKLAVRAHGINPELRNTQFTALKVKDAICDALRSRTGARPDIDADNPDALIEVRVRENRATITFDVSGSRCIADRTFDAKRRRRRRLVLRSCGRALETVGAPEKLRAGGAWSIPRAWWISRFARLRALPPIRPRGSCASGGVSTAGRCMTKRRGRMLSPMRTSA